MTRNVDGDLIVMIAALALVAGLVAVVIASWYGARASFHEQCEEGRGSVRVYDDIYVCVDDAERVIGAFQ